MSDLPVQVMEAGLLFQRAEIERDTDAFKKIINFGHAQIDATYPEDPIRAPLNVIRRQMARWEWAR